MVGGHLKDGAKRLPPLPSRPAILAAFQSADIRLVPLVDDLVMLPEVAVDGLGEFLPRHRSS
ncbi:hypothetical protein GCM10012284_59790 [Mangrovihabitans endophyticus]|uniref:Uncharacterized protein n=1 Tax=Mangrovihabitans endophyticus TaxID=1751298 RepID=A0A8J3FRM1_9ACTN|nr:hypothetical protein GCM10012284_59790 [Mangrovihabitans endophyticus]